MGVCMVNLQKKLPRWVEELNLALAELEDDSSIEESHKGG
jgi:hypothetical protein